MTPVPLYMFLCDDSFWRRDLCFLTNIENKMQNSISKVEIGFVSLHAIEKEMEDIPFCCWVAPPLLLAAS